MNRSISILDLSIGVPFPSDRTNVELPHQSQDRFVIDLDTIFSLDPDDDPPIAIGFPRSFISLPHQLHSIFVWIGAVHALHPGIICGSRDAETPTRICYAELSSVSVDDPVSSLPGNSSPSSMAKAFKSVFSISNCLIRSSRLFCFFFGLPRVVSSGLLALLSDRSASILSLFWDL